MGELVVCSKNAVVSASACPACKGVPLFSDGHAQTLLTFQRLFTRWVQKDKSLTKSGQLAIDEFVQRAFAGDMDVRTH